MAGLAILEFPIVGILVPVDLGESKDVDRDGTDTVVTRVIDVSMPVEPKDTRQCLRITVRRAPVTRHTPAR